MCQDLKACCSSVDDKNSVFQLDGQFERISTLEKCSNSLLELVLGVQGVSTPCCMPEDGTIFKINFEFQSKRAI